jgi:hypothetical protein
MISISDPAIMLEGAKLSEDGKGLILHVYNSSTSPITADIALNGFKLVSEVGVMEDKLAPFSGNSSFRGFELKCLNSSLGKREITDIRQLKLIVKNADNVRRFLILAIVFLYLL